MGDFGLRAALGEDGTAKLIRRQRQIARRYGKREVVERMTAWLVANGHETPAPVERVEEADQ